VSTATGSTWSIASFRICIRLPISSYHRDDRPVIIPPGRRNVAGSPGRPTARILPGRGMNQGLCTLQPSRGLGTLKTEPATWRTRALAELHRRESVHDRPWLLGRRRSSIILSLDRNSVESYR
jgi:hypothetical protein